MRLNAKVKDRLVLKYYTIMRKIYIIRHQIAERPMELLGSLLYIFKDKQTAVK